LGAEDTGKTVHYEPEGLKDFTRSGEDLGRFVERVRGVQRGRHSNTHITR